MGECYARVVVYVSIFLVCHIVSAVSLPSLLFPSAFTAQKAHICSIAHRSTITPKGINALRHGFPELRGMSLAYVLLSREGALAIAELPLLKWVPFSWCGLLF